MNYLISVIIPTKNRSSFLSVALSSFVEHEDIEVIVVDDKSNMSEQLKNKIICQELSANYFINEYKAGASNARNYGASKANGKYYWFFDDDDNVTEKTILELKHCINSMESDIYLLPMNLITNNTIKRTIVPLPYKNNFNYYRKNGHQVNTSCMLFKNEVISQNLWDGNLLSGQDTDLILRASMGRNISCLTSVNPVNVLIDHNDRITKNVEKQINGKIQFYKKNKDLLSPKRKLYYLTTYYLKVPYIKKVLSW
ncbi:glycosyltransferase [Exiguobacterium sp. s166]|uniref:glycosyltransferase family 2 protein n=1 Tax=Exiguobacterium sp. s166 TaxID=2751204 RepID=UPI001BECA4C0|nr:glycosyltransferase [Exiguobacterium sp. s166]